MLYTGTTKKFKKNNIKDNSYIFNNLYHSQFIVKLHLYNYEKCILVILLMSGNNKYNLDLFFLYQLWYHVEYINKRINHILPLKTNF